MYRRGDIVRLTKVGVPGYEEKLVHSFDGETIIFDNGKRLRVDNEAWTATKVRARYILDYEGERMELSGEFALYREDSPPWELQEDIEVESIGDGQVLAKDERGLVSLTRASATSEQGPK